jgi:hypothetical protein
MRLLAYGGTSYNERQRIGAWSDIPRGALESTYGLPEQSLIYGLGVLDAEPFLVIRQRQLTETGRAYAFSLLLDPGRAIWERFGWNAAGLTCALFDGADSLGAQLLKQPEAFNEEGLGRSLVELQPPIPTHSAEGVDNFLACWTGALLADSPVTASPQSLGFEARPLPDKIFERTAWLPPCFQIGMGWLVGGSRENGQAFGSYLVLDDFANGEHEEEAAVRECVAGGQRVLEAWETISADPEFAPALARLAECPLWEWADVGKFTPAETLGRLVFLAELLKPSSPVELLLKTLRRRLEGSAFLSKEINRAAHRLALVGEEKLDSLRTFVVLSNYFDEGVELPASAFPRLHREKLIQFFVGRGTTPTDAAKLLPLPMELRRVMWVKLLGASETYANVPGLLREAAGDRVAMGGSDEANEQFVHHLLDAVRVQTMATSDSLHVWDSFPREHPVWPGVAEVLREEVLQRALRRGRDWKREYLLYGQDPGGISLHGLGFDQKDAPLLVKSYRDEVRAPGPHAGAAAEWLALLADSSLRRVVSVSDKREVAELVGGKWQSFTHLWRLYRDQKDTSGLTGVAHSPVSRLERKVLCNELLQMTTEAPAHGFTPNLRGLVEFLEELPEEVVKYFKGLRPRLSSQSYESWIGGWKLLKEQGYAEDETVRFILEGDGLIRDELLFRGFSDQKIEQLFHRILFLGTAQDDARYRTKFEHPLPERGYSRKLREAVKRVFHSGQSNAENMRVFLRRFAGHAGPLDGLFRCLSLRRQDSVVDSFARHGDDFSDEVYAIYVTVQKSGAPLTTYERAMLRYLLGPKGKSLKRMIAHSAHLSFRTKGVDESLSEIMGRPAVLPEGVAEEVAEGADAVEDDPTHNDDEAGEDDVGAPATQASAGPSRRPKREESPSFFGRAWGFVKSLLTQPELDEDPAGDAPPLRDARTPDDARLAHSPAKDTQA